jgi:tRNA nucleotidyltransferase (CCA-adding enzyme)
VPAPVRELCDRLSEAGFRSWIVGGCVRDLLRGVAVADWDLATDATPDQVRRVFRRTIPTGIAHGTVTVLHRGVPYEVTTLRGEGAYTDGRRPDEVRFVSSIEEDLARRDFTVNAIAYDPRAGQIVDPWGGVADLAARRIRAVRDPRERFSEDGLRVLRAARFVATLEFELDPETEAAIPPTLDTFRKVSAERVRDEWAKTLVQARAPSRAFEVMRRTGILAISAPALAALDDAAFARTIARLDAAEPSVPVRIAALLLEAGGDHERWMRAMRFSNEEQKIALHLLRALPALGVDLDVLEGPALRRALQRASREHFHRVMGLARADRIARRLPIEPLDRLEARARAELERGVPLEVGDLAIDGCAVMRAIGSGPGRHVGQILGALLERVIEDPERNDEATLIALVPEIAAALAAPAPRGGPS